MSTMSLTRDAAAAGVATTVSDAPAATASAAASADPAGADRQRGSSRVRSMQADLAKV
jgi:hypothetical protein